MTAVQMVQTVAQTISVGGNALINVGPAADGTIDVIFADRLRALGAWLRVNGAAIYGSSPWRAQNDTAAMDVWYTRGAGGANSSAPVYAIFFTWPADGQLTLLAPVASAGAGVTLLGGDGGALAWAPLTQPGAPGMRITLPAVSPANVALATAPAWTLALAGVS